MPQEILPHNQLHITAHKVYSMNWIWWQMEITERMIELFK